MDRHLLLILLGVVIDSFCPLLNLAHNVIHQSPAVCLVFCSSRLNEARAFYGRRVSLVKLTACYDVEALRRVIHWLIFRRLVLASHTDCVNHHRLRLAYYISRPFTRLDCFELIKARESPTGHTSNLIDASHSIL